MLHKFSFVSFISAFCSFGLYSILVKEMSFNISSHTELYLYSQSLFLFALACSSLAIEKLNFSDKFLVFTESLHIALILLLPFGMSFIELSVNLIEYKGFGKILFFSYVFLVGVLAGFPLGILLKKKEVSENYLLFFNYVGSFFASIFVVFYLLKSLELVTLAILLAFLNSLVVLVLARKRTLIILFVLLGVGNYVNTSLYSQYQGKLVDLAYLKIGMLFKGDNLWKQLSLEKPTHVKRFKSHFQKIDIVPEALFPGTLGDNWGLFINHKIQFYSDTEKIYHETMVHYPLASSSKAQKVLILGGGDLRLANELLKVKRVESIDLVELDQKILDLSFSGPRLNRGLALKELKERVNIIIEDAFTFLRRNKHKYDLIILDFPFPHSSELLKLYSKEFYQFARSSLTDDGQIILDFPMVNDVPFLEKPRQILLKTLEASGFAHIDIIGRTETFVIAANTKRNIDYEHIEKHVSNLALANFIVRTDEFRDDFTTHERENSIFQKNMDMIINE